MTEDALLRNVLQLAKLLGLRTAHFRPARVGKPGEERYVTAVAGDGKGFVDLVIVGPRGVAWRELKADGKYLEPEQRKWRDALLAAGCDWAIWRPRDLRDGRVQSELGALR